MRSGEGAGGAGTAGVVRGAGPADATGESAGERRVVHAAVEPGAALAIVAAAAEDWGGIWEASGDGGRVALPVQAGLRRGRLDLAVAAARLPSGGVALTLAPEGAAWALHRPAAALLALSAGGGLVGVLWPFVPALGPLAPMGVVLALGGWLVVLSRLRHHGLEEFAGDVEERLAEAGVGTAASPPAP